MDTCLYRCQGITDRLCAYATDFIIIYNYFFCPLLFTSHFSLLTFHFSLTTS